MAGLQSNRSPILRTSRTPWIKINYKMVILCSINQGGQGLTLLSLMCLKLCLSKVPISSIHMVVCRGERNTEYFSFFSSALPGRRKSQCRNFSSEVTLYLVDIICILANQSLSEGIFGRSHRECSSIT